MFRILGMDHVSCRPDLLARYRSGRLEEIFAEIDRHESFEDWPYPLMYKELLFRYGPDAKFVLTRRSNAAKWLNSLKQHSLTTDPARHCRLLAYGYAYPHGVESHFLELYERHEIEVRQFFRRYDCGNQLLEVCWEDGHGWTEICAFLDLPRPNQPFPHKNKTEGSPVDNEIRRRKSRRHSKSIAAPQSPPHGAEPAGNRSRVTPANGLTKPNYCPITVTPY